MTEAIMIAVISALGGGFLGSIIQSLVSARNAEKERELKKRLTNIERVMKALEIETDREWKDRTRREERYFNLKLNNYMYLYGMIANIVDDMENEEKLKECIKKINETALIFDGSVRDYYDTLTRTPKDDIHAVQKSLASLAAALSIDIVERHCLGGKRKHSPDANTEKQP